ncbi:MAG: SDR family oxidoreductase [Cyclobacteriaceae bacterium]
MHIDLSNKRALVCGSSKGIGLAIAQSLAKANASITLMARNEVAVTTALNSLNGAHHNAIIADFSDIESVSNHLGNIKSARYDVLINNTGGPSPGSLHTADIHDLAESMSMHLHVNHLLSQAVLEHMKQNNFGRIINIISTSVRIPIDGLGVSNTVRGAVASWAKTLSNEVGKYGITVNSLLPGFIETDRLSSIIYQKAHERKVGADEIAEEMKSTIPVRRFGKAQEMGALATFLCSDQAAYINGTTIPVDGGKTGTI